MANSCLITKNEDGTSSCGTPSPQALALAIFSTEGMGSRTALKLLTGFEMDYERAWFARPQEWEALGIQKGVIEAWVERKKVLKNPADLEAQLAPYQKCGVAVIPLGDSLYPQRLLETYDPPSVLFVRGSVENLSLEGTLAVVGTRHMSDYGQRVTAKLVGELVGSRPCIVSGLAQGIDATAHRAALRHGLPTVAVFGCGIDVIYPRTNRRLADEILESGGTWVSEYPLGVQPVSHQFPRRNRIVAGLSQGVLVIEGSIKSGSLITARLALDENRSVMTIPHNLYHPDSEGPHELLRQGAVLVTEGDHIRDELGWNEVPKIHETCKPSPNQTTHSKHPRSSSLKPNQKKPVDSVEVKKPCSDAPLLQWIHLDPTPIEKVIQYSGFSPTKVQQALTLLELEGVVSLLPGHRVVRLP